MRKIVWSKWQDPLAPLVNGYEQDDSHDDGYHEAMKTFGESPGVSRIEPDAIPRGAVVIGKFGIIPMTESNLPGKLFNFWMADTNFCLTGNLVQSIEKVAGVETLDVMTRYRFRLGVGRAFDEDEVKLAIVNLVAPVAATSAAKLAGSDGMDKIKRVLASRYRYWAIVRKQSGDYTYFGAGSRQEVIAKASQYHPSETIFSWE